MLTAATWGRGLAWNENFDRYILNLIFLEGSGLEQFRKIRRWDALTPVAFHSGYARQIDQRMVTAAGAPLFLNKPVSLEEWERVIPRLLNGCWEEPAAEHPPPALDAPHLE